jgi:beta-N-acetylhexosaminidase
VLFGRNLTQDPMQCAELTRAIATNSSLELPPLIAIDQEGGRVARLRAPILELPAMDAFGRAAREASDPASRRDALALAHDSAKALGAQLGALGVTMNFAPVLDVNTRADNPIIGDRAFGDDAPLVADVGLTWALGLREGGVMACGKHFPGHGSTSKDSHLDLPVVERTLPGDLEVDLHPFRRVGPSIAAFMTAHVLYPSLDADFPATLSRRALALARECLGRTGCIVSDDLEMKAVADRWTIEESAVRAIEAGCDALLVCKSEELQERAVAALSQRASTDAAFRARVTDAHARFVAMRREVIPQPVKSRAQFDLASAGARAVEPRIAAMLARSGEAR